MPRTILVLPGDGIGQEVTQEAVKILDTVSKICGEKFEFDFELIGGASIDKYGNPIADRVIEKAKKSDAVLLGAVGGPKWDNLPIDKRPEAGLLKIRKSLELWANIRPVKVLPGVEFISPLKQRFLMDVDFIVLRELSSDIYYGNPREIRQDEAFNTAYYKRTEIERIARLAFEIAKTRRKRVSSIDKANVLEVYAFWRQVVSDVAKAYPDVELEHIYVDAAALYIVLNPARFDVILAPNLFGDILSDEGGGILGSLGLCPSASLGGENLQFGLYEPVHGSAPDIAGKGIANPVASILSAAMLLRYSFKMEKFASAIEKAVYETLNQGIRTQDMKYGSTKIVSTSEFGDYVIKNLKAIL